MWTKPKLVVSFMFVGLVLSMGCKRKAPATAKLNDAGGATNAFKENRLDPLYCTTRVKFKYKDPSQNLSGTASVRMVRDSAVWVSVSVLFGIEAARLMFYPDRLELANKLEGGQETYRYTDLSNMVGTPVSLGALQALVLGNSPINGQKPSKQLVDKDTVWQQFLRPVLKLALLKSNRKMTYLNATDALAQTDCHLWYDQFGNTAIGLFANHKALIVNNPKGQLNLNLEHTRIDFPTERPELPW
jgi:hypothetical protein